jgi:hypothetical protein
MPDASCAICRILDAASGQRLSIAAHLLRVAARVPCRCAGARHAALVAHPHTRTDCLGYHPLLLIPTPLAPGA